LSSIAALFELDGVSKSFGALRATDNLTLSVDAGEALAVIGPNGAGKSTLFNLITGDLALDCGRIVFARADISELAPHARSRLLASGARTRLGGGAEPKSCSDTSAKIVGPGTPWPSNYRETNDCSNPSRGQPSPGKDRPLWGNSCRSEHCGGEEGRTPKFEMMDNEKGLDGSRPIRSVP
jgi:energy-coupling factor transporter ATP-binding protein EcfA2